jgi:hypothetical protein
VAEWSSGHHFRQESRRPGFESRQSFRIQENHGNVVVNFILIFIGFEFDSEETNGMDLAVFRKQKYCKSFSPKKLES